VDASYKLFIDEQERPDLAAENYKFIVGKEPVFSAFNTDLMGLKKEDQKDVQVVFPGDYSIEDLRNKNALVKMTINKIMKREIPELNDDFAKKLGKFETVEQLKNNIRDGVQKEKEIQEEERIRLLILEKIKADISVELPEVLVERETKNTFEDVKNKIAEMGMEFTEYLNQIKKTEEDVKKDIAVEAKNKVMNALILREIIRLEKIEPTQEEIDQRAQDIISEISIQNPGAKNIDINMIKNYSAEILRNEKVFDLLLKVE
jgi:trigger factor